jgi:biopolymer transport protein ExbD
MAQKSSINLPEGDEEIKITTTVPIFSIYITDKGKVFLEDQEIVKYTLDTQLKYISSKLPEKLKFRKKIFLYIDKGVSYEVVDVVKTELAHVNIDGYI